MFSSLNDFKHIMKAKTGCGYTCEIGCRKHSSNLHDVNCFVKCGIMDWDINGMQ